MSPEQTDPSLAAAVAVARRLLMCAINLRFDLDEAVETANGSPWLAPPDLQRLRADAAALLRELDHLTRALPSETSPDLGAALEEESDEVAV
jgi:hypothetical protein